MLARPGFGELSKEGATVLASGIGGGTMAYRFGSVAALAGGALAIGGLVVQRPDLTRTGVKVGLGGLAVAVVGLVLTVSAVAEVISQKGAE